LAGVEDVSGLSGLNDIFSSSVKFAKGGSRSQDKEIKWQWQMTLKPLQPPSKNKTKQKKTPIYNVVFKNINCLVYFNFLYGNSAVAQAFIFFHI
jgi:hypothetical protein